MITCLFGPIPITISHLSKFSCLFSANKNYNTYFTSTEEESSFVCVRHPYIPSLEATPDLLTSNASFNNSDRAEVKPMYTWVGHCVLEKTLVHAGMYVYCGYLIK